MKTGHGTWNTYNNGGCRCDACKLAGRRYRKRRHLAMAEGNTLLVEASDVRAHLVAARESGVSIRSMARAAGVSYSVAQEVHDGGHQRIARKNAAAILAVDPVNVGITRGTVVDATGTVRRVRALACLGWSGRAMAVHMGVSHPSISRALAGVERVNAKTQRRVAAAYRRLILTPPPQSTVSERVAASKAQRRAVQSGWAGPFHWNDIDNDPAPERAEKYRPISMPARALEMSDMGIEVPEIARRLKVTEATATEYLRRAAA